MRRPPSPLPFTRRMLARMIVGAAMFGAPWCAADIGPVTLRDGRVIASEQVQSVTDQGVVVEPGLGADGTPRALLVPWIEVVRVGPEGSSSWGEAEAYRAVTDALSRAELRLSRGDVPGAMRLLDPLAERYLDETGPTTGPTAGPTTGPTTGLVASALVICRTLRDDRANAARAWLAWRETREGPDRSWIDAATGLAPALPPIWTARDGEAFVGAASAGEGRATDGGSEHATVLAGLYARAARHAMGATRDEVSDGPSTRLRADAGVRLAWEMVRAQVDPELTGRREARDALRRRLRSGSPAWEEAWAHLGIGASLLGEVDPMDADAGAAELVGVLIEHRDAAPGLAGLAMTLVTDYFERTGRPDHAAAVAAIDRAARRGLAAGGASAGGHDGEQVDETIDPVDDAFEELP